jgi:hypothetical protein
VSRVQPKLFQCPENGCRISGRLERAKTLLASMVKGDLTGVNALITARQVIVDGLHKMRQLAADPALRSSIATDAAQSLSGQSA